MINCVIIIISDNYSSLNMPVVPMNQFCVSVFDRSPYHISVTLNFIYFSYGASALFSGHGLLEAGVWRPLGFYKVRASAPNPTHTVSLFVRHCWPSSKYASADINSYNCH
jgi:hypothetical protein